MENSKSSLNGYRLDFELKNVPVAFVNGLRRIVLSEIPTVVVRDVEILDNSSQLIHEMLRHRTEILPINVTAEDAATIRDTTLELRFLSDSKESREVSTDDFVVAGPKKNVILKDRDLGTPLVFMNLRPNEGVHIRAHLGIDIKGASQVCVSTFKNHIDENLAKLDKDTFVLEGGDPKVFDNHHIQRSYARDENGRPNHFDFSIESIGVMPAKDILRTAVGILQTKIEEWCKIEVLREDKGWFRIETESEGHTIGALAQSMMYNAGLVEYVSYEIPHPLLPKMVVRFNTKLSPEAVIGRFKQDAMALCESILKSV
jgi:DNA-directed RNA polymerase I and III subunit RPAC1